MRSMSHLLNQKEDAKAGIQKMTSGKPGSSNAQTADRNTTKKNLNLAVDIINRCFNVNAPKSV